MTSWSRAAVAVAATLLLSAGCQSRNAGVLDGTRWASASVPDMFGRSMRGVTLTLDFAAGGGFRMGLKTAQGHQTITGKWRTAIGDYVELYDLSEVLACRRSHLEKVVVAGDTLTMTDSDGTQVTFTSIDEEMERLARKPLPSSRPPAATDRMASAAPDAPRLGRSRGDGAGSYR